MSVSVLFVGNDWAEAHHDVEIQQVDGTVLVRRRLPEGVAGLGVLHGLIGEHLGGTPSRVRCWLGSRPTGVGGCRR